MINVRDFFGTRLRSFVEQAPYIRKIIREKNQLLLEQKNYFLMQLKVKGLPKKLYPSFSAALSECTTPGGYENDLLTKTIAEKQILINLSPDYPTILPDSICALNGAISRIVALKGNTTPISVIDFGGSAGGHYFFLKQIFWKAIKFNWRVVETENLARAAKPLESDELKFFSTLPEAVQSLESIDLVYCSGTLQSLEYPYETTQELVNLNSPWIFFNRMAFTDGDHDVIGIFSSRLSDNGHGKLPAGVEDREVQYPFYYIQKKKFDQILNRKYNPVWATLMTSGFQLINEEPISGSAIFYERKDLTATIC